MVNMRFLDVVGQLICIPSEASQVEYGSGEIDCKGPASWMSGMALVCHEGYVAGCWPFFACVFEGAYFSFIFGS